MSRFLVNPEKHKLVPVTAERGSVSIMHVGMTVRGRVRNGRLQVDAELDLPDNTEVELAVILDQDDAWDVEDQSQLDARLATSISELAAGAVTSFDEVIGEI